MTLPDPKLRPGRTVPEHAYLQWAEEASKADAALFTVRDGAKYVDWLVAAVALAEAMRALYLDPRADTDRVAELVEAYSDTVEAIR